VKFEKESDGGETAEGLWYPAAQGFRPGHENEAMQLFLAGAYVGSSEEAANA
jgi:hypothetical protein